MNGEVAQICALTCWANAILKGNMDVSGFNDNSSLNFCNSVQFFWQRPKSLFQKPRNIYLAHSPEEWFDWLRGQSCNRCYINVMSRKDYFKNTPPIDEKSGVAFSGGGPIWVKTIELSESKKISCIARWGIPKRDRKDKNPWEVEYIIFHESFEFCPPNLQVAQQRLRHALEAILEFSVNSEIPYWPKVFEEALVALDCRQIEYSKFDLIPAGFVDDNAARLLISCSKAWVFGGMGSWNDIYVNDQMQYEEVSTLLFQAIKHGLVAGTNCSAS